MQVTKEELNPCTVQLTVVCDESQVKEAFDRAFRHVTKKIKLPGFRPGNAPKAMLQSLVDPEELSEHAAETLVRKVYEEAIKTEDLHPDVTTRPTVDVTVLKPEENRAEMVLKIPLPPKIELGEYKGLPLVQQPVEVSDEEVDRHIEDFRRRRQTRESITDRGVQHGDVCVVNIKSEGEAAQGRNFMTIAGQTFPALDEALNGMQLEEIKSADLTFPENFQEKDWAGRQMHVQLSLTSISTVKLPDLDDEFAKQLETESVKDLRERVTAGLRRQKEAMTRDLGTEDLLNELHHRSTVFVSDNMWEQLAQRRLSETADEQRAEGKTLEEYAAENGMTFDEFVASWNEKSKMHVERALLIREVFVKESMQLTNEEVTQELVDMAGEMQTDPTELLDLLRKNGAMDELQYRAVSRKVADFLHENAQPSK